MNDLAISYDATQDVVTIEGMKYSGAIMRAWSERGLPVGACFAIEKRSDGVMWIKRVLKITREDVALCKEAAEAMSYVAADMMTFPDTGPISPVQSGEARMRRLAAALETFLGEGVVDASHPDEREA